MQTNQVFYCLRQLHSQRLGQPEVEDAGGGGQGAEEDKLQVGQDVAEEGHVGGEDAASPK